MFRSTYAIAFFALVATLFAQNGVRVPQGNSSQPNANTQDSASQSPAAPSATLTPDSIELEPIQTVQPVYPNAAREQNIVGQVLVMILVSEAGDVEYANVVRGDPPLRDAAVEAAKRWRFKPFFKAGRPVEAIASLSFEFGPAGGTTNGGSNADPSPLVRASVGDSSALPNSVRVSSGVTQGLILNKVAPAYPKSAKKARIQGSVVIAATISTGA